MIPFQCSFEDDVLSALGTGRWPERVDPDLRAHVDHCAICRDLVTVAAAFAAETDRTAARTPMASARVPDASVIWLRAQLRARQEAARTAARPITIAQTVSFASIVGLLGMLLGASSPWLQRGVLWLTARARSLNPLDVPVPTLLLAALADHLALVIGMSVLLLLMPVALYVVMREPGGHQ